MSNTGNSSANGNGVGNGNNTLNETYVNPRQTPSAVAPSIAPTVPCFKGYAAGGSGPLFGFSLGGGKIDENCAELEAARVGLASQNRVVFCKVYLTNKYVKKAGVTLVDCIGAPEQPAPIVVPSPEPPLQMSVPSITVNIPAPQVTVIPAPVVPPAPSVAAVARTMRHRARPCKCVVTNDTLK